MITLRAHERLVGSHRSISASDAMHDPVWLVIVGFLLGLRHAADADHVVAVATIASRQNALLRAIGVGAMWGAGHTLTLLFIGGAIVTLGLTVPPRLGLGLEFTVALMLIGLGAYNLLSKQTEPQEHPERRSFVVGMVHGLAGSAAVALLVLTQVTAPSWAAAYLLLFGIGTVLGMALVTCAIALPSLFARRRQPRVERFLRLATGALSVAVGLMLAHEIGIVNGLFFGQPHWEPR